MGFSQEILPNNSFEDWTEYSANLLDGFSTSTENFLNEPALPDTNFVEQSVSASEIENAKQVLFPNPTTGSIQVVNGQAISRYYVVDLTGKTVQSGILNNNQIDMSSLTSGVYLVQLQQQNGNQITQKVILK